MCVLTVFLYIYVNVWCFVNPLVVVLPSAFSNKLSCFLLPMDSTEFWRKCKRGYFNYYDYSFKTLKLNLYTFAFYQLFTTTYIFVNTVKYASSTKSQKNKIKIKTSMQAHAVCLWKNVAWVIPTGLPLSHS